MSKIKCDTLEATSKKEIDVRSRLSVPHFYSHRITRYKDIANSTIDNDSALLSMPSAPDSIEASCNLITRQPKSKNLIFGLTFNMSTAETPKQVQISFSCVINKDVANPVIVWEKFQVPDDTAVIYKELILQLDASKFQFGSLIDINIIRDNTIAENHSGIINIHGFQLI